MLFKLTLFTILIITHFAGDVFMIACYYCANYGRQNNDYPWLDTCDQTNAGNATDTNCSALNCFYSRVQLADLSYEIIRGCSNSCIPRDISDRLQGYNSELTCCNSTFCNSSTKTYFNLLLYAFMLIIQFYFV